MKRLTTIIICVCLLLGVLCACDTKQEEVETAWTPPVSEAAPGQVIAGLDANATAEQFGLQTWQAFVADGKLGALKDAFVSAGYTPIEAATVSGVQNPPVVLGDWLWN
jgi:hypothetical protein